MPSLHFLLDCRMDRMNTTQFFMLGSLVAILLFDAAVVFTWGHEYSISKNVYRVSVEWPIIPFLLGIVAGHVLWPLR